MKIALTFAGATAFGLLVLLGFWVPFLAPHERLPDDTDDLGLEQYVGASHDDLMAACFKNAPAPKCEDLGAQK